jgi:CRISPR-associated endoribonuclease Cas6
MIYSTVIIIKPKKEVILPACTGNYIHGFFYKLLKNIDKIDTDILHEDKGASFFTVSPINGYFQKQGLANIILKSENDYWFRITTFDAIFAEKINSELINFRGKEIKVSDYAFHVEDVILDASEHEWAGSSNYNRIYKKYVIEQKNVSSRITLNFYTPTTFSSGDKNFILPLPDTVFNNLLEKWIRYGELPFSKEDFLYWLREQVVVSKYELRTRMWNFQKYKYVGFVGRVEFLDISKSESVYRCLWNVLSDYAFFAGIGAKTTMGMGMVRREK